MQVRLGNLIVNLWLMIALLKLEMYIQYIIEKPLYHDFFSTKIVRYNLAFYLPLKDHQLLSTNIVIAAIAGAFIVFHVVNI